MHTVFQIFDEDGDGQLSYREFIAIMKDRLHRGFKVKIYILFNQRMGKEGLSGTRLAEFCLPCASIISSSVTLGITYKKYLPRKSAEFFFSQHIFEVIKLCSSARIASYWLISLVPLGHKMGLLVREL